MDLMMDWKMDFNGFMVLFNFSSQMYAKEKSPLNYFRLGKEMRSSIFYRIIRE